MYENLNFNDSIEIEKSEVITGLPSTYSGIVLTLLAVVILISGSIVHRAVFKLLKRLSDRPINQIIYPHMVSNRLCHTRPPPIFLSLVPDDLYTIQNENPKL